MFERTRSALRWTVDSYVLFVALGIVFGLAVAPVGIAFLAVPDGTVAVVPVQGSIDGQQSAEFQSMMAEAEETADAIVLVANSGGGGASASEEMYMQTVRTSEQMPVVAAVDGAALSGAYYAVAPADEMYVKPASFVGSVGVLADVPQEIEPNDLIGATGPNKLEGFEERQFFNSLETTRNAFLGSVMEHRGDRIEIDETDVSAGTVFGGAHAVENGMADEIGDRQAAIESAADRAGLDSFSVEVVTPPGTDDGTSAEYALAATYHAGDADQKELEPITTGETPRQGSFPTLLMAHPGAVEGDGAELVTLNAVDDGLVVPATEADSAAVETAVTNETTTTDTRNGTAPSILPLGVSS